MRGWLGRRGCILTLLGGRTPDHLGGGAGFSVSVISEGLK